ncbi:hypothetical protein KCP70_04985 [Salmonella enterica subsp. enterica]|nr:hypothetical protein KCP70_04985 [Salmonella enterica subsp. enterica]
MPGLTMLALPVIGQNRPAVLWRLVGNEWAHRSGNLRCVLEFSRYADQPTAYWHRFWLSHSAHRRR